MKRQLAKRNTSRLSCILSNTQHNDELVVLSSSLEKSGKSIAAPRQAIAAASAAGEDEDDVKFIFTKKLKIVPSSVVAIDTEKENSSVVIVKSMKKPVILDEVVAVKGESDQSEETRKGSSTVTSLQTIPRRSSIAGNSRRSGVKVNPRRSSVALLRGKRASSVIGGDLVLPHPSVSCSDFHSLISTELPGPHRMRQLFIWTFQDLLRQQYEAQEDSTTALKRHIVEAAIKGLTSKDICTSWYQRPIDPTRPILEVKPVLPKATLPNPRNLEIKAALQTYEAFKARMDSDKKLWLQLLDNARAIQPEERVLEADALVDMDLDAQKFLQITEQETQKSITLWKEQRDWLTRFQFKADLVVNALSTSSHFEEQAKYYCENLFKSIYYKFILEKEKSMPSAFVFQKMDTLHLLRTLSRVN